MGLQALNLGGREWYTPPGQDDENPTRFELRGLTGSEQARLAPELVSSGQGNLILPGRAISLLLEFGLVGWDRYNDDQGPVEFDPVNRGNNQDRIPYELQTELAMQIFTSSRMSADVKKKS